MELSHNQRLKKLIRSEKLNNTEFSKTIDYTPKNLGNYLNGNTAKPNAKLVTNILKYYPNWNIRYWLLGHGAPKLDDNKIVVVQEPASVYNDANLQELTTQLALLQQELKKQKS